MKRHALFVGVDDYADPTIQNLAYPAEDATELASVFRRLLKFDRVEKLTNPAHAADVVDAVKDMTKGLGPGDLFLFFFAGHGFRVKDNHVLVCAKDEFVDLEDEYVGLPVGRLKKRMRGPWNRMLVLDACQNDIQSTLGADCGVASRDLALIHTSDDPTPGSGFQVVVTACSEGQKALEVSGLGHGLFTSAFLDSVTAFADARRRIDLEALRTDLGGRMGQLIAQYRLSGRQEPMFTMPADAGGIVLFDGVVPSPGSSSSSASGSLVEHVVCPACGRYRLVTDTFRCRVCGRDYLCQRHYDESENCCKDCVGSERVANKPSKKDVGLARPMIVHVEGGICKVSIISNSGIDHGRSIDLADDDTLNDCIIRHMRRIYNLQIGERTAESIKRAIGSAYPMDSEKIMEVCGRDIVTGLPRNIAITSEEIRDALSRSVSNIVRAVRTVLDQCEPDILADLLGYGIVLSGECVQLRGLDKLLAQETGLPVSLRFSDVRESEP